LLCAPLLNRLSIRFVFYSSWNLSPKLKFRGLHRASLQEKHWGLIHLNPLNSGSSNSGSKLASQKRVTTTSVGPNARPVVFKSTSFDR